MPVGVKARQQKPRPRRKPGDRGKDRVPGGRVKDPVPVGPLRDKALELIADGWSYADICRQLGWMDRQGKADTTRLQRRLGLRLESPTRRTLKNGQTKSYGGDALHGFISYERAVEVARALGLDPVDVKDPVTGESLL